MPGLLTGSDWSRKPSVTPLIDVRMVFDTNFFGAIAMMQTVLPLLRKSGAGRIVNVSSSLGSLALHSNPDSGLKDYLLLSYNASKTALNAATVQFRERIKRNLNQGELRLSGLRGDGSQQPFRLAYDGGRREDCGQDGHHWDRRSDGRILQRCWCHSLVKLAAE